MGRELQYLVTLEVERYVLDYYVNRLTGKGLYVTYDRAMNILKQPCWSLMIYSALKYMISNIV